MNTIQCITEKKGRGCCPAPFSKEVFLGIEIDYNGTIKQFRYPYEARITGVKLNINDGETVGTYDTSQFHGMTPGEVVAKLTDCILGNVITEIPRYQTPDAAYIDPGLSEGAIFALTGTLPGVYGAHMKNALFVKNTT